MFGSWKRKVQNKVELEIVFGKLEFLSSEFERGTDRKIDAYLWKQLLDQLDELHDGTIGVRASVHAYHVIYKMFLNKHSLDEEMTLDELIAIVKTS